MDWTSWQNKALKLINKYGADARIVSTTSTLASYSPATDTYASSATLGYATKIVFTDWEQRDENGYITKIKNGALLIPAKDVGDLDNLVEVTITIGSETYQPKEVAPIQPGGIAIVFKVRIK